MFEFAQSQHTKHPPSRRLITSSVVSCAGHLCLLILLIEYPQLMGPGSGRWLRSLLVAETAAPDPNYRIVTVLHTSPMQGPSTATLKKYMKNWNEEGSGGNSPPVLIRWGNAPEQPSAAAVDKPQTPVRPVPGSQEPKPVPVAAEGGTGSTGGTGASPSGSSTGQAQEEIATAKGTTVYLPAPVPGEPKPLPRKPAETAGTTTPAALPESRTAVTAPSPESKAVSPQPPQVFKDEKNALHTEGSGLFDTKGFPLGDYATIVIERVKGNWSIPSNLRNSQGRTTVVFYIDKDGTFTDAKIVIPSGFPSLDLAALNAVIGSNPFPPLPRGFPGDHVGAKFVFSYNERQ
jgi:TonB family protein